MTRKWVTSIKDTASPGRGFLYSSKMFKIIDTGNNNRITLTINRLKLRPEETRSSIKFRATKW